LQYLHPIPEGGFDNRGILGRQGIFGTDAAAGPFDGCIDAVERCDFLG
jgi:hypothetical protein